MQVYSTKQPTPIPYLTVRITYPTWGHPNQRHQGLTPILLNAVIFQPSLTSPYGSTTSLESSNQSNLKYKGRGKPHPPISYSSGPVKGLGLFSIQGVCVPQGNPLGCFEMFTHVLPAVAADIVLLHLTDTDDNLVARLP